MRRIAPAATLLSFLVLFPSEAHAYLDPGTGSFILQMVIGAVLGGIVTIGLFWKRISSAFKNFFNKRGKGNEPTA
jgi:hypothetical protein